MKKLVKKIVNHPLFSGSALVFAGNMGANVINYVYHLVFGRMLGPVDYGVLASLYSILYLVSIIPSSASISIVKFISTASNNDLYSVYESIRRFVFKIAIGLSIFVIIISPTIVKFLHIENILLVILIAPILFFSLVTLINQSTAQGILKFNGLVIPTLISSILKLVVGVIFVLIGWSVSGAMFAIVLGAIISFIYSYKFITKQIHVTKIKKIDLSPFIKYSGPVLLQALSFTSIFTVDVILAKHFLDPFSAGIYAALSTLGKIIFFSSSPVAATMFPVISKRKSQGQGYIKVFFASFAITTAIALSITLLFWLFPDIAIGVLYGKDYLSAKSDLVWMGFFILFYTLSNLLVNFYLSIGKIKIVMIPLFAAVLQMLTIWFYHDSIATIIYISLFTTLAMFTCLLIYTIYNLLNEE